LGNGGDEYKMVAEAGAHGPSDEDARGYAQFRDGIRGVLKCRVTCSREDDA